MTIERDLLELDRDPALDTKPELLAAVFEANARWLPRFFPDG